MKPMALPPNPPPTPACLQVYALQTPLGGYQLFSQDSRVCPEVLCPSCNATVSICFTALVLINPSANGQKRENWWEGGRQRSRRHHVCTTYTCHPHAVDKPTDLQQMLSRPCVHRPGSWSQFTHLNTTFWKTGLLWLHLHLFFRLWLLFFT